MTPTSDSDDAPEAPRQREASTRKRPYAFSAHATGNASAALPPMVSTLQGGNGFTDDETASKRSHVASLSDEADKYQLPGAEVRVGVQANSTVDSLAMPSIVPGSAGVPLQSNRPFVLHSSSSIPSSNTPTTSASESSTTIPNGVLPMQTFPQPFAFNPPPGLPQNPAAAQAFQTNLQWSIPNSNLPSEGAAAMNAQNLAMLQQTISNLQSLDQQGGPNVGPTQPMPPYMLNPFTANTISGLLYQQFLLSNMVAQNSTAGGFQQAFPFFGNNLDLSGSSLSSNSVSGLAPSVAGSRQRESTIGMGARQAATGGRGGPVLYLPSDDDILSDHQCLLRKQIEFFEANIDDVETITPGRRKDITLGQVGIRCKHCAGIAPHGRTKGAVYFPAKLKGLYQAAQNMAASHFCDSCRNIDPFVRAELRAYNEGKAASGHGGKQYWADGARVLGVIETEEGLRFAANAKTTNP